MNRQPSSRARQHSLRPETVGAQAAGVLTFQLRVPLHAHKLLMLDLVEKAAVAVLVRHTEGHPDPPALTGPCCCLQQAFARASKEGGLNVVTCSMLISLRQAL